MSLFYKVVDAYENDCFQKNGCARLTKRREIAK